MREGAHNGSEIAQVGWALPPVVLWSNVALGVTVEHLQHGRSELSCVVSVKNTSGFEDLVQTFLKY